jgi:uncharacterized protein YecE (DUF72 family)
MRNQELGIPLLMERDIARNGSPREVIVEGRVSQVIFIGTAGWVVPAQDRSPHQSGHTHLHDYSRSFNAVEINSSFKQSHRRETYERWATETPEPFRFAVKLPRTVTHDSGLRGCRRELELFVTAAAGLGKKLAVLLTQLPPSLEFNARVARSFFEQLSGSTSAVLVCEARHPSWFSPKASEILLAWDIHRVIADPIVVPMESHSAAGRFVYHRLHGSPRVYYSAYSETYLTDMARRLDRFQSRGSGWCIFDNTAAGEAWPNGRLLRARLKKDH